jgi:hypothetical protein
MSLVSRDLHPESLGVGNLVREEGVEMDVMQQRLGEERLKLEGIRRDLR